MTEVSADRDPVEVLAEDFVERHRRGERPALSEYTQRFPEHADAIRTLFPALVKIEQLKPAALDATGAFTPVRDSARPQQLGDFRILREVGRGGMGIVYEAEQTSLGRHVALKVLPRHALLDPRQLQRFQREARAAARLHHTNIVPVHGIGEHDGLHYYVMQFIQGLGLDVVMAELKTLRRTRSNTPVSEPTRVETRALSAAVAAQALLTGRFTRVDGPLSPQASPAENAAISAPLPNSEPAAVPATDSATIHLPGQGDSQLSESSRCYWQSIARVGIQVADAIAYASNQGVLHRDIKPSNLLLDAQGTVWVTDFGLAKAEADPDNLTHTGDIVGTVRYMAPERFSGKGDLRADIYSLGLTLYEMAALRPAFDEADRIQLMNRVLHDDAPPPRKINPAVPRDLETIILKAVARDPAQRYATATALADDLKRFVEDRPIQARRASARERVWRWCRRNPSLAALTTTVALLLGLVSVISSVAALWLQAELKRTDTAQHAEKDARRDAQDKLCRSHLAEANARRLSGRAGQRFESLAAIRKAVDLARDLDLPEERVHELRNAAIACLALPDIECVKEWDGWPAGSDFMDLDATFEHYARADVQGNVSIRRLADDVQITRLPGAGRRVGVRLSRDARLAAVHLTFTGTIQPLKVWRLGPTPTVILEEPANQLDCFDFSPAGDQIVFALADGTLRLHDFAQKRTVQWQTPRLTSVVFDPHGTRIAGSADGRIVLFDVKEGKAVKELPCPTGWVRAWDAEGQRIAVTHDNKKIYILNVSGHAKPVVLEGHRTFGMACSFHPHDEFLVSNDWDGVLRLWDLRTGRQILHTPYPTPALPRFAPDGETLSPRFAGQKLQTHRLATGRALRTIVVDRGQPEGGVLGGLVANDDRMLVLATGDSGGRKGLAFADLHTGRVIHSMLRPYAYPVRFDERGLLTFGHGVLQWPLRKHPEQPGLYHFEPPQTVTPMVVADHIGVSGDGNVLALSRQHDCGVLLHRDRPDKPILLGPQSDVRFVSISPDAQWVATGSLNTQAPPVKIWNGRTGEHITDLPVHTGSLPVFSPSGRWLATMGLQVRLWKTGSWEEGPRISGTHAAFAPDDTVAVGDDFGVVRLVDPSTGREYARLEMADQTNLLPQCFTSDGAQLVVRGRQTLAAYVWDLRMVRAELKAMGLDWDQPDYPAARPAEPRTLEVKMESTLSPQAEAKRLIGLAIQQRRKQPVQAIETLRLAVRLDPQSALGYNNLAWLLVTGPDEVRNPGEAVSLARQAVALAPKMHFYHNTLGVTLYRNGQFKEAITSLETSLQGSQGSADAFDLFFLAMCRHRLGATAAARDDYTRAVRWVEDRAPKLSENWRQELADFRAEADILLKPE